VFPDLIGRDRQDIVSSFGAPTSAKGKVWEYEGGETQTSTRIEFQGSIVVAVQWDYYLD
jgi:hypothetical protein